MRSAVTICSHLCLGQEPSILPSAHQPLRQVDRFGNHGEFTPISRWKPIHRTTNNVEQRNKWDQNGTEEEGEGSVSDGLQYQHEKSKLPEIKPEPKRRKKRSDSHIMLRRR